MFKCVLCKCPDFRESAVLRTNASIITFLLEKPNNGNLRNLENCHGVLPYGIQDLACSEAYPQTNFSFPPDPNLLKDTFPSLHYDYNRQLSTIL